LPLSPSNDEAGTVIYRFQDQAGRDGWFAIRFERRGRNEQIKSARVADLVWPYPDLAFTDVLPAIIEVARLRSDLLSIRGRVGLGIQDGSAGLRRRTLLAPEGFLFSRTPPTDELVKLADFPFTDRY
jgi:hypothetical protein